MILDKAFSLCDRNQRIIKSSEGGKTHIANNPDGKYCVRHYRLDGVLVKNKPCCDYLLLNDTSKKSYYIELKGSDIRRAVTQVIATEMLISTELSGYISHFRIVAGKARTGELKSVEYRRLLQKVGKQRLKCQSIKMTEKLD